MKAQGGQWQAQQYLLKPDDQQIFGQMKRVVLHCTVLRNLRGEISLTSSF